MTRRGALALLAAGLALVAGLPAAPAAQGATCTISWAAPVDGLWGDASRWDPPGAPPTYSDDVCITVDGTYTVTLEGFANANTLTVGATGNTGRQTLWLRGGTTDFGSVMLMASSITNWGTIRLESIAPGWSLDLRTMPGTLANAPAGIIDVGAGPGGDRSIHAPLDNQGTIQIASFTTIDAYGRPHTNSGTISLTGGDLNLFQYGPSAAITNTGNIAIAALPAPRTLTVFGGTLLNPSPGRMTEGGNLVLQGAALRGVGSLGVNVSNVGGFVEPGASPGLLSIDGSYTQDASAFLSIELAGPAPGTGFDRLAIGGPATLAGTLNVSRTVSFIPDPCGQFGFLTYGSHTGDFATVNGLGAESGRSLRRSVGAAGQSLVANTSGVLVDIHPTDLGLAEGGQPGSYGVCLASPPAAPVSVTALPADALLGAAPGALSFTGTNWEGVQAVAVTAVDDAVFLGTTYVSTLSHQSASADPAFNGLALPQVTATIADNDGGLPAAVIDLAEIIAVSDTSALLPPAIVGVDEVIVVADAPGVLPPALLLVDEILAVADTLGFAPSIFVQESVGVADAPGFAPSLFVAESVSVADGIAVIPPAVVAVAESVAVADGPALLVSAVIMVSEAIAVSDAAGLLPPALVSVNETVAVGDAPAVLPPAVVSAAEAIAVGDSTGFAPSIYIAEAVGVADASGFAPSIFLREAVGVADTPALVPPAVVSVAEAISVSDAPRVLPPAVVSVAEAVGVADGAAFAPSLFVREAVGVSDAAGFAPSLFVRETVGVSDSPTVIPPAVVSVREGVGVQDAPLLRPPAIVSVAETVGVADAVTTLPPASVSVSETIAVADAAGFAPSILVRETVGVADAPAFAPSLFVREAVGVADAVTLRPPAVVSVSEAVAVHDSPALPNDPPTISNILDVTIQEDFVTGPMAFTVGDVETPAASLSVSGSSSNATLVPNGNILLGGSGAGRTVVVKPLANQHGTATITITVGDTNGATASDTFVLTVTPVNDPPAISTIADQVTDEDTPTTVAFTVGDPETPAGSLAVSGASSNTTLVPDANILFGGSGSSRTVTITPAANLSGTASITVTVTDAGGLTASDAFVLTVNPVNDPPTISDIGDQTGHEDIPKLLGFAVGDAETPADGLVAFATASSPFVTARVEIPPSAPPEVRGLRLVPAVNWSGTVTITVTVRDADGATASDSFLLTLEPVNDPPQFTFQAPTTILEDSAPIEVPIQAGDVDSPLSDLTLSAESLTGGIIYSPTVVATAPGQWTAWITPVENAVGLGTIAFTVYDHGGTVGGGRDATTEHHTIRVSPVNDPPVAADDSYDVAEDGTLRVAGIPNPVGRGRGVLFNDRPGPFNETAQTMVAIKLNDPTHGTATLNEDGTLVYTPTLDYNGTDSFTYKVRDNGGLVLGGYNESNVATVTITVTPVNDPPAMASIADQTAIAGAPTGFSLGSFADPDAEGGWLLNVNWGDGTPSVPFNMAAPGAIPSQSHTYADGGIYTATVRVTDTVGAADARTFRVAVTVPDRDTDGVPNNVEDDAPNGGDGNQDGVPDSQQAHVASLPGAGGQYVTIVGPAGTQLTDVRYVPVPPPGGPSRANFPVGMFEFTVTGVPPGGAAQVTFILPAGTQVNSYYKYGPTPGSPAPHWYKFLYDGTTGAKFNGNRVTLFLVDGQRGDHDLLANGSIHDPGAPAEEETDLALSKAAAPDPVQLGQVLTYTLALTNTGPAPASGVTVTDTLPAGVAFGAATASQGSCAQSGGAVTCALGDLEVAAAARVTLTVTATAAGTIANTATVTAAQSDPEPANNSATATTRVNRPPVARDDAASTRPATPVEIDLRANDADPDGDAIAVAAVTRPGHGTAAILPNGAVRYSPDPSFSGTDTFTYALADGRGGSATATVRVDVAYRLRDFAALGSESIWLREGARVLHGDVGASTAQLEPGGRRAQGRYENDDRREEDRAIEVRIGEHVQMLDPASRVVGDSVWLRSGARVYGVHANELINRSGAQLATWLKPLGLPLLSLPTLPAMAPGAQDQQVRERGTLTLPAGSYGTISVGPQATLILSGGTYQVASLDIRQDARVLFRGPSQVLVKNEMDANARSYIGPDPGVAGLRARDIRIVVAGADDKGRRHSEDRGSEEEVSPTVVQIGEVSIIKANVYAVNGTVWLKAKSEATGAFIGRRVRIGEKVTLDLDSGFP